MCQGEIEIPFYYHFSLCIGIVQKQYQNRPPYCDKIVRSELVCSMCTEIRLYRIRPPLCPEVVMLRYGPTPVMQAPSSQLTRGRSTVLFSVKIHVKLSH